MRLLIPARKHLAWLTAIAAALMAILVLGFIYRRFLLSGLDLIAQGTGSRKTALLAVLGLLLVIGWLLVWLLFPLIVYLGLRDLRRRTTDLDQTTRACLDQLARLTAARDPTPSSTEKKHTEPGLNRS
jgi:hypothetical protein